MTHEEFIDQHIKNTRWHISDDILYIDACLELREINITSLPNRLYCNYYLGLDDTNITSLPEDLYIVHSLWIKNTKITELPQGLFVGDWLDLRETEITSIPDNLSNVKLIFSDNKLEMTEKTQLGIISNNKGNFQIIKNPTEKAKTLHNLLWKL